MNNYIYNNLLLIFYSTSLKKILNSGLDRLRFIDPSLFPEELLQ